MGTTKAIGLDTNWLQVSNIGEHVTIILQNDWEALVHYGDVEPANGTPDFLTLSRKSRTISLSTTTSPVWCRSQGSGSLITVLKG